ncbi:MAG: hypothetical protein H6Q60_828 [Oscillospiraceae bacterium]|nr:hypothetical protein [Oscillospiraceae bacterium]
MLSVYVANLSQYNSGHMDGHWLKLPASDPYEILPQIGVSEGQEYFCPDCESDIEGLASCIGEYPCLHTLNELATAIEQLEPYQLDTLKALLCVERFYLPELLERLEELDEYQLIPAFTDEELGHYYAEELGTEIPTFCAPYFDYEAYGSDISIDSFGCFTKYGFLLMG